MKIALTIAGSDSGGGAGIQADLKTFQQFGVFGTTVIVALTAQNTLGVRAVEAVSESMVSAQLTALAEDLPPAALKTGMLAEAGLVRRIARAIREHGWAPRVVDPVMVSSSGSRLLTTEAEEVMREDLLPLAALVTPNLDEAAILTGRVVHDPATMERAGAALLRFGAGAALVKGGHLPEGEISDVLVTHYGIRHFTHLLQADAPVEECRFERLPSGGSFQRRRGSGAADRYRCRQRLLHETYAFRQRESAPFPPAAAV